MALASLRGSSWVKVTDLRTRRDRVHLMREMVEDVFPHQNVFMALDNLNVHAPPSSYEAFEAAEARRTAERLEIHYVQKQGSWLNISEIEIGVLSRQCLSRRIPDRETMRREVAA